LSFYLDTNVLLSLFFQDAGSDAAAKWLEHALAPFAISDWSEAEFHAVVNRWVRSGALSLSAAKSGAGDFDEFARMFTSRLQLSAGAGELAAQMTRDAAMKLAAADALHLALAVSGGHSLVTFDQRLAEAARQCAADVIIPA